MVESSEIEQQKGIRSRAAVGKMNVAIMAESIVLKAIETEKNLVNAGVLKQKHQQTTLLNK